MGARVKGPATAMRFAECGRKNALKSSSDSGSVVGSLSDASPSPSRNDPITAPLVLPATVLPSPTVTLIPFDPVSPVRELTSRNLPPVSPTRMRSSSSSSSVEYSSCESTKESNNDSPTFLPVVVLMEATLCSVKSTSLRKREVEGPARACCARGEEKRVRFGEGSGSGVRLDRGRIWELMW